MIFKDLNTNSVYSLTPYTETMGVLSSTYTNLTLISESNYEGARNFLDIQNLYTRVKATGLSLDTIDTLTFYIFKTEDNEFLVLAKEWIEESSLVVVENVDIQITIPNIVTSDISIIKALIRENGYEVSQIVKI